MSIVAARIHASPILRWLVRLALATSLLLLLIGIAWLVVPHVVRAQIEERLTAAAGRKTTVEAVEFNPFLLVLKVRGLAVGSRAGAAPLVAIDEIVADVSAASLWHRAPVLDAVKLVRPTVSVARDRDGRYDVQDLIDRVLDAPPGPPPAFSLNNIEVDGGAIVFADGVAGRTHRVERLVLAIPFLSSLPYATDIRVAPRLAGEVNGSRFALNGTTLPFGEHREAAIDIDLDAVALRDYLAYLPDRLLWDVTGGTVGTRLRVVFVDGTTDARRLELRGELRVDGLALARQDRTPLASVRQCVITLGRVDLFGRDARVQSLTVDGARVDLRRRRDGTLEIAGPWFAAQPAPASAEAHPWSVTVDRIGLSDGALALVDESSGFRTSLADVTADVANLSTKAGTSARARVSFVSADRIAAFKGDANFDPIASAATGRFELTGFSLALLFPFYNHVMAVDVQRGSLDFAGAFTLSPDGRLTIGQGRARMTDLTLAYPGSRAPFLRFPDVTASGVDVDVHARSVRIADLAHRGAVMKLSRERDGSIDVAHLVRTTSATGTPSADHTWTVALGKLAVDGAAIDFEDRMQDPVVKVAIRDMTVSGSNWSNARGERATMTARARIGSRGRAAWSGTLGTNPVIAAGQVDVQGLDLVMLRPYLESRANVSVTSGAVAARGTMTLDASNKAATTARWKGDVTVTDFAALDKPTASDLLRFKRLALEGLDVASDPVRFAVARIGIEDYFARLIVYADGTLNLTRLLVPEAPSGPTAGADVRPSEKAAAPSPWPVSIGGIDLARGNVNYSDYFIHPNFTANLTEVTGNVTKLSGEQAGDVVIAARVDRAAPVEIAGRVHPFGPELSLDIKAKARDVDLPPLTPYSVKYAGYGIEKGKLTFDVHYRVENRKLTADNRLVLDQLTFNPQHIASDTATKLPVLLAVALLKDTRGVIDIELPIAGSLDDPQFSVGGLIVRVIVNLIAKAATAPFALLSAAFGKGEELSVVPFAAGSAALDDDARQRIDTLGKALAQRPGLRLDIGGRADPAVDRDALRHAAVETAMKREKMKSLVAAGTAPASLDLVTIDADERSRWLAAAYRESTIKDRPRNALGMLRELPPAETEAMLLAAVTIDDDSLRLLANARAQAVKEALVEKEIAGERLFLTVPRLAGDAVSGGRGASVASGPPSRVDLALR